MKYLFILIAISVASIANADAVSVLDLVSDQCNLAVADLESGFLPKIELNETPLKVGDQFVPGVVLTSQSTNASGLITSTRLQLFLDEQGHRNLDSTITLSLDKADQGVSTQKLAHFRIELTQDNKILDFKEQLGYEVRSIVSKRVLNVPGKSRFDSVLHAVPQAISLQQNSIAFERTTANHIAVILNCKLNGSLARGR